MRMVSLISLCIIPEYDKRLKFFRNVNQKPGYCQISPVILATHNNIVP
jgi:hypothetical protein